MYLQDLKELLEKEKSLVYEEKKRLGLIKEEKTQNNVNVKGNIEKHSVGDDKENVDLLNIQDFSSVKSVDVLDNSQPLYTSKNSDVAGTELNLKSNLPSTVEAKKNKFIDELENSDNPFHNSQSPTYVPKNVPILSRKAFKQSSYNISKNQFINNLENSENPFQTQKPQEKTQRYSLPNSLNSNSVPLLKSNDNNLKEPVNAENSLVTKSQPHLHALENNLAEKSALEVDKKNYIKKLENSEYPYYSKSNDASKCAMLRFGEFSPNNPQLRVTAAPYLGLGEYEQQRNYFAQKRRADYLDYLSQQSNQTKSATIKKPNICNLSPTNDSKVCKGVQTDIQNVKLPLIQHDSSLRLRSERELGLYFEDEDRTYLPAKNKQTSFSSVDQRLTSAQNALLRSEMDKPKSILSNRRTGSPRDRHLSEHCYTPTFMDGFSFQETRLEGRERERSSQLSYQRELRSQIDEKRRLQALKDDQDRREQELENHRLEQQLLRMQEEAMIDDQRKNRRDEQMRRHSEDLLRRKHELQSRHGMRKHTDSESSVLLGPRNSTTAASKALSHYSPPVSRRSNPHSFTLNLPSSSVFAEPLNRYTPPRYDNHHHYRRDTLNRMDLLNSYDTYDNNYGRYNNAFSRFDSLSRIDSLSQNESSTLSRIESLNIRDSLSNVQRRHSATQQDLSVLRRSPKLHRRSSSNKFDDNLPIPVLKAHSPVAKELKNSIPFNSSRHGSDIFRKIEDKWQIPAVQKNILNHSDMLKDGQNKSILTQLGAIRMQLQQEQLRMDESLRKRGITQNKAVDFR